MSKLHSATLWQENHSIRPLDWPKIPANPLAKNTRGGESAAVIPYAELEDFFSGLVATAQARGITCAITSGMACVHFGVAATTKDCDVLCDAAQADAFRELVAGTPLRGVFPNYRGNLSPPLDSRWMGGGWTSHFTWKTKPENACLDIFGIAPRGSSPWQNEIQGFYASRHTVAEMKRTNREKDWPFITALGMKLLNEGDGRGCLHIYDATALMSAVAAHPPSDTMQNLRPSLRAAVARDPRLEAALHAEQVFWHQLDACRIRLYERALRPYVSAVRSAIARRDISLGESHDIRVACATAKLPLSPISSHGFDRLVEDARQSTSGLIHPSLMKWLPNATGHFTGLGS